MMSKKKQLGNVSGEKKKKKVMYLKQLFCKEGRGTPGWTMDKKRNDVLDH